MNCSQFVKFVKIFPLENNPLYSTSLLRMNLSLETVNLAQVFVTGVVTVPLE